MKTFNISYNVPECHTVKVVLDCYGHFLCDFMINLLTLIQESSNEKIVINIINNQPLFEINKFKLFATTFFPNIEIYHGVKDDTLVPIHFPMFLNIKSDYPQIIHNLTVNFVDDTYPCIVLIKRLDGKKMSGHYKSPHRVIRNIDKLDAKLQNKYNKKYKMVTCEKLDWREQIKYFVNAKIVVGVTGSGNLNAVFMRSGGYFITDKGPRGGYLQKVCKDNEIKLVYGIHGNKTIQYSGEYNINIDKTVAAVDNCYDQL